MCNRSLVVPRLDISGCIIEKGGGFVETGFNSCHKGFPTSQLQLYHSANFLSECCNSCGLGHAR